MKDSDINIFCSEEDEGCIADLPDLEACSAFGLTPEEALREGGGQAYPFSPVPARNLPGLTVGQKTGLLTLAFMPVASGKYTAAPR
jgi:hypothetical protein